MLDLMAVKQDNGPMPLYLNTINRILRDMRKKQQASGGHFDYAEFKRLVDEEKLTPTQIGPLTQRLDTLESFMPDGQSSLPTGKSRKKQAKCDRGNDWTPQASFHSHV